VVVSAAGAAGASEAGADSLLVAGAVTSGFAQAVSTRAAASAPRASLMFIDQYPEEKQVVRKH